MIHGTNLCVLRMYSFFHRPIFRKFDIIFTHIMQITVDIYGKSEFFFPSFEH